MLGGVSPPPSEVVPGRGIVEGPRYTSSMTTTIKVSDDLRDRLKDQAARDGLTLGAHLERLADAEDRRRRLESVKEAIARTSASGLEEYAAEVAEWESTDLPAAS